MKYLFCLVLIFLLGCKSYDLEDDRKTRVPNINNDNDSVTDFDFPEIEDLGLDEIRENRKECYKYTNHTAKHTLFRDKALFTPIVNCIAYNIDYGLEPICEAENRAKEELKRSNDDDYTDAIEEYLDDLEDQKFDFIEDIFDVADDFEDVCDDLEDEISKEVNEIGERWVRSLAKAGTRLALVKDCERVSKVMINKSDRACSGINFEALYDEHRKK